MRRITRELQDAIESGNTNAIRQAITADPTLVNGPLFPVGGYLAEICWPGTLLHMASLSWQGTKDVVELLVNSGSDIHAVMPKNGMTPLHCAAISGTIDTVTALLAAGADPRIAEEEGYMPCEISRHPQIRALLREATLRLYPVIEKPLFVGVERVQINNVYQADDLDLSVQVAYGRRTERLSVWTPDEIVLLGTVKRINKSERHILGPVGIRTDAAGHPLDIGLRYTFTFSDLNVTSSVGSNSAVASSPAAPVKYHASSVDFMVEGRICPPSYDFTLKDSGAVLYKQRESWGAWDAYTVTLITASESEIKQWVDEKGHVKAEGDKEDRNEPVAQDKPVRRTWWRWGR